MPISISELIMGMFNHGFTAEDWTAAKAEAHAFLAAKRQQRALTTYGELADNVTRVKLRGSNGGILTAIMSHFCGELSIESYHAGRGMISALIGSRPASSRLLSAMPSKGFFILATQLGYNVDPEDEASCALFWVKELSKVFRS